MSAPVQDDLSDFLHELFDEPPAFNFYGTRDYNDPKPEPKVAVGESVCDRDGLPWFYTPFGWVASGDGRPQAWRDIQQWFEGGGA